MRLLEGIWSSEGARPELNRHFRPRGGRGSSASDWLWTQIRLWATQAMQIGRRCSVSRQMPAKRAATLERTRELRLGGEGWRKTFVKRVHDRPVRQSRQISGWKTKNCAAVKASSFVMRHMGDDQAPLVVGASARYRRRGRVEHYSAPADHPGGAKQVGAKAWVHSQSCSQFNASWRWWWHHTTGFEG